MTVISGDGYLIKNWATNLEQGAVEQATNAAKLPCIFRHVAVMPDGHQGCSFPIGGVMALKNAICPNAIGVDQGCLDNITEVLTPEGWIQISRYAGQAILQYSPERDIGFFEVPKAYIKKPGQFFFHLKNSKGLDQVVSDDHNLLVFKKYTKRDLPRWEKMRVEKLYENKSVQKDKGYFCFKTCFNIDGNEGVPLSNELIRVDVMVQADGRIVKSYSDYRGCEIHVRKERKIIRARKILAEANINFHEYKAKDGSTYFSFHIPLCIDKTLGKYYNATRHQLEVVCEECLHWDGHKGYRSSYSSTNKENVDVIQFAYIATNRRASLYSPPQKANENILYYVIPTKNEYVGYGGEITKEPSLDGYQYCFTTSTGYFLARRNGYTFLTGNCGMRTCKTSIKSEVIADMRIRRDWLTRAKSKIPVGEGNCHRDNQEWERFEESPFEITDRDKKNLGSLGGGNHFSSVEHTQDGYVQLLLHSGSRNLGHRICTKYSQIAETMCRRWCVKMEDYGLAFLPIGEDVTEEFIKCLNFALDYAKENRRRMMFSMQEALRETLEANGLGTVGFSEEYDVHHNYATLESHFGENVWVHRKGATSAKKGEICIIPGSMGTASYLCLGLGNPESFMSCSHGAGRKMSRSAASQTLTEEECNKAMEGIVCDRWNKVRRGKCAGQLDLSEAPGAYKDIEEVIANEADLVKPIVRLTPLAVLKG